NMVRGVNVAPWGGRGRTRVAASLPRRFPPFGAVGKAAPASRTLRAFDRWQRFDVERDRAAVLRRKFRRIGHHRRHRATDRIAVGQISGLEDAFDVPLRVVADSCRRDVGDPAVAAFWIGPAGKALARDGAAEAIAGAVALRAMARTVDEISAAIPRPRLGRVGLELLPVEKQEFPASEHMADLKMEREVVAARLALHRRQRL